MQTLSAVLQKWLLACGRLALAALLWWLLAEGDHRAWLLGAPAVLLATAASLRWSGTTPFPLRLGGMLRFGLHFLHSSLGAGIDVARRALSPRMPLDPLLLTVGTRLPAGPPRWLLGASLSLVPGSLMVEFENDKLLLHCLDRKRGVEAEVRQMEQRIAALFGLDLEEVL